MELRAMNENLTQGISKGRINTLDVQSLCLEIIQKFEPCTEQDIISCLDYRKRVTNISNALETLEREKKIRFLPRTKCFVIRRD